MKLHPSISRVVMRVRNPVLVFALVNLALYAVENLVLGSAAFPGGHIEDGRYLVDVHGGVIELTRMQFWVSYAHGISVFVTLAMVAVLTLLSLDNSKDESSDASE